MKKTPNGLVLYVVPLRVPEGVTFHVLNSDQSYDRQNNPQTISGRNRRRSLEPQGFTLIPVDQEPSPAEPSPAEPSPAEPSPAEPSPAEQFRAEAVAAATRYLTAEAFKASADRVFEQRGDMLKRLAQSEREDLVRERDDLLNRVATLERELYLAQTRNAQSAHDYRYLLEMERHAATVFRERIAAIMKAFYHAELSISSTQPIIALALELNPDLVERAR